MYLVLPQQLAAQHIAELHQQAARQRLIRELRDPAGEGRPPPPPHAGAPAVPAAAPGRGVSPWMRGSGMIGGVAGRVSSPVLVGRDAEVAQLRAALERAAAGQPAIVVVAGEAGVGKTRLVAELLGARRRGSAPSRSPAAAWTSGKGSWRTRRWSRRCARSPRVLDPEELERVLGGARAELARLVPELGPQPEGSRRPRWRRRGCSSCCSGCCTAWPSAARCCWWSRTCTGPTSPPATCSGSWPATCAAGVALVLTYRSRRAAPAPSAAAVPGRAGPQRPGRAAGARPAGPPRAGRAARRDPRRAGRSGAGRGDPGPLGGQPVLRRGAAGRPPGGRQAAAGPAGPAAGPGGGAVGGDATGAGGGGGGRHPGGP